MPVLSFLEASAESPLRLHLWRPNVCRFMFGIWPIENFMPLTMSSRLATYDRRPIIVWPF